KQAVKASEAMVSRLNAVISKLEKEEKKIEAAVHRYRIGAMKKLNTVESRLVKSASKTKTKRGRPSKAKK
ncbi:MAG: hypothetical protein QM500_20735, partial [Methylococcales bacterium]